MLYSAQGKPTAYWADGLTTWDLVRLKTRRGDPAWQAEWELLAVLFSLIVFRPFLAKQLCRIQCHTDSRSALSVSVLFGVSFRDGRDVGREILLLKLDSLTTSLLLDNSLSGPERMKTDLTEMVVDPAPAVTFAALVPVVDNVASALVDICAALTFAIQGSASTVAWAERMRSFAGLAAGRTPEVEA